MCTYGLNIVFNKNLKLVLLCKSSVNAFEKRDSVRETWQTFEQTHPVKIVFVLGLPPLDQTEELQKRLELESRQHGDILQERFMDTYQNLTLKSMFVLKFSVNFLQNKTEWIMAIDDDSYVNIILQRYDCIEVSVNAQTGILHLYSLLWLNGLVV